MRYEEIVFMPRENVEESLASGDHQAIRSALLSAALHDPDWRWVEQQCLRFAGHHDGGVRGIAAMSLGHLARIHGVLNLDSVRPVLRKLSTDPDVREHAADALADLWVFLPLTRQEAEQSLASGDPREISETLSRILYHDPDWRWVQEQCLRFTLHNDADVRRAATASLGYMPFHYHVDDFGPIITVLNDLMQDSEVAEQAKEALSIINRSIAEEQ